MKRPNFICTLLLSITLHVHQVCFKDSGVSDHRVQIAEFDIQILCCFPDTRHVRAFRRCNWHDIFCCLSTAPWSAMEMFDDVNDMWEFFCSILYQCLDCYVPLKKIHCKYSKRHTPWLTDELLSKIYAKNKAKRLAEHSKDPSDISQYKTVKNKLKSAIRSAKLDYLRSLLCRARHTPQFAADLWSEINDTVGHPKKQAPVLDSRLSLDDIN